MSREISVRRKGSSGGQLLRHLAQAAWYLKRSNASLMTYPVAMTARDVGSTASDIGAMLIAFVAALSLAISVQVIPATGQAEVSTITVHVGGANNGGLLLSRLSVTCDEQFDTQYVDVVEVPVVVQFVVPRGFTCRVRGTLARFGPMFGNQPVAFATAFPNEPINEDLTFGALVGENLDRPVHWLILTRSGAQTGTRPVALQCESVRFERVLNYGAHRIDTPQAETCTWDIEHIERFDASFLSQQIPEPLYRGNRTGYPSTVAEMIDGFTHPDDKFTEAIIRSATGRDATEAEVAYWEPLIGANPLHRGRLVDSLAADDNYAEPNRRLVRLYQAYFDRSADLVGLEYWRDLTSRGVSLISVSQEFATSREFQLRYGASNDEHFIRLAYANILERSPDPGGLEYWQGVMADGLSGPEVILYFSESAEYRNATLDAHRVDGIYRTLVGGSPTDAELRAALAELRQAGDMSVTANSLIGSADYVSFFADHYSDLPQAPN